MHSERRRRRLALIRLAVLGAPALLLAIAGAFHPTHLTIATADRWVSVHLVALPLFGLFGVSLCALTSSLDGWIVYPTRALLFTYAAFYTGLDAVSGIANGVLVQHAGTLTDVAQRALVTSRAKLWLYAAGDGLGWIGVFALWAAVLLIIAARIRDARGPVDVLALIGLAAGAALLGRFHIFPPRGVLGMALLALSVPVLAVRAAAPSEPSGRKRC